jgi:DNA-binding CsgD family transcriptional regulator
VTTLHDAVDSLVGLSPRQREVVILIVQGLTYLEIGAALEISERTAREYSTRAKDALGCKSSRELVRLVWGRIVSSSNASRQTMPT